MKLVPYLFFDGTCEAAFTRYREIFGGEFGAFMRVEDGPEEYRTGDIRRVMHVSLPIGESVLMGSDSTDAKGFSGVSVSINLTDREEARRIFEALAEGGEITMALQDTFWGALFGSCRDRFGVAWMVNAE